MTAITPNEFKALQGVYDSDYRDGNSPVDHPVWSWSANPFASKKTFGGVVASLVKKGLVDQGGVGEEAVVSMTQAGYDAWIATGGKEDNS
jgi:hypothetical protein